MCFSRLSTGTCKERLSWFSSHSEPKVVVDSWVVLLYSIGLQIVVRLSLKDLGGKIFSYAVDIVLRNSVSLTIDSIENDNYSTIYRLNTLLRMFIDFSLCSK